MTETSAPTVPLVDDVSLTVEAEPDNEDVLVDAGRSFIDDRELLARETAAARDAGEHARADALLCAQALRAAARGDADDALVLWWAAFDRDASLLLPFWGVRAALAARGAWPELLGVLERRIRGLGAAGGSGEGSSGPTAPAPPDEVSARERARADLWLSHGRLLEDRLGRDEEAVRSYRSGLIEAPRHPGLLLALLLLGWRRGDTAITVEALTGILRLPVPPSARARITAAVARIERRGVSRDGGPPGEPSGAGGPESSVVGAVAASRALETLRGALQAVGPGDLGPLVEELITLARSTADPPVLAEILGELVRQVSKPVEGAREVTMTATGVATDPASRSDLAVRLLRERARLLRDAVGDAAAAREALRQALALGPGHPLVLAELADLVEDGAASGAREDAAAGLAELLALVAPGDGPLVAEAERELGLRYAMALGRGGQAGAGLAFLRQHPELTAGARADVEALVVALSAVAGDVAGLAATFDSLGERFGAAASAGGANERAAADRAAAAHAHLVAGTLRERAPSFAGDPMVSYDRALALQPDSEIAAEAIERRLRATESWPALGARWEARLSPGEAAGPDAATRRRLLEELVALHRDDLRDPGTARHFQDQLVASGGARALLRRLHLELAAAGTGHPAAPEGDAVAALLRALGDAAGTSTVQTGLHVEAGRAYAARGATREAEEVLRATLSTDTSGMASSGLERLPAVAADGRADIVRAELARLDDESPESGRPRALRFRLAHHLAAAGRASEAVEALEPLRSVGDETADALVWEIARRSGNADLETAVLEATAEHGPDDPGGLTDLGEARERAGDLAGAAEAYRRAIAAAPSADAGLGLFRVGALTGEADVIVEASRVLGPFADQGTRVQLDRDREMLSILGAGRPAGSPEAAAGSASLLGASPAEAATGAVEDQSAGVLGWARGVESGDAMSVSAGLLALARSLPRRAGVAAGAGPASDGAGDREGLLVRAATRARLGGVLLSGAVHDQAAALSEDTAALAVGLSDLPVAGRPERAAARVDRAGRGGGRLGYALHLELAVDAELQGEAGAALGAFARAAALEPSGIEALDGIRRVALASGNPRGAAQAGMRLGAVLRTPRRAATELRRAAALWCQLGMTNEAKVAYFRALEREPGSDEVFAALRTLLRDAGDDEDLERLLTLRLAVVAAPEVRLPLLIERGALRHDRLNKQDDAIQDFKRSLKIDPAERRALRELATLAAERQCHPQSIAYLERLLAVEDAPAVRAALWLELAEAHESARDPSRALEILHDVIVRTPSDLSARQRLVDVQLRAGDWTAAVVALRSWEAVLPDPVAKAGMWIRIGDLQRDHGRDRRAAEEAYGKAAALQPLGEGLFRLAELHRAARDLPAVRAVLSGAVADLRRALAVNPLDVPRLERLRELCSLLARGYEGDRLAALGVGVVGQLLGLLGEPIEALPGTRPTFAGGGGATFWDRMHAPGTVGFAAEIWRKIARAAGEVWPPDDARLPPRDKVTAGSEPRLGWIETAAAALGISGIKLALAKRPDPGDESVVIVEGGEPALLVGRGALAAGAVVRFRVGRALGLLHAQATALERLRPGELEGVFAAAAVAAGAGRRGTGAAASDPAGARGKQLARSMSRKDLKALELEASRFDFEPLDAAAFRAGVLQTADRVGLLFAGDLGVALEIVWAGKARAAGGEAIRDAILAEPRALHLVRFALSEEYLALRLESGAQSGPGEG